MISTFTAFFDSNVFFGHRLRSLTLYLAQTKLFRARWSEDVHREWMESVLACRPDLSRSDLQRTRRLMDEAVPDCLVHGYKPLISAAELPDPDDRHVVAAAIVSGAKAIVTFNLRDFPPQKLAGFRIEAVHPDKFLTNLIDIDRQAFLGAVRADFEGNRKPRLSPEAYLGELARAGVPHTAAVVREASILGDG